MARPRQATRHAREPWPNWLMLVIGFAAGILVATVFVYRDWAKERRVAQPPSPVAAPPTPPAPPRLGFYDELPNQRIAPVPASPPAPVPSAPATPAATPPTEAARLLVVGSFPNPADADTRKAQLALLGFAATIQQATVNGETRHRVVTGPYASDGALAAAREELKANGLDAFQLR